MSKKAAITLSYNDVPLIHLFRDLETRYGCNFVGTQEALSRRVTVNVKNVRLPELLNVLSGLLPLEFSFGDNVIFILPKKTEGARKLSLLPGFVKGKITDVNNNRVIGVSVINRRTMHGVFTDSVGRFELQDVALLDTLVVTHVNYRPVELPVFDEPLIAISLTKDVNQLPPVVVNTGYQDIPVEQATGSFRQVNMKQVAGMPRFNVQEGFENYVSGYLPALKTRPGPGLTVGSIHGRNTIYGNAQALVLLDNFPFYGDLYMLNPNDIESITVAKDASSAAIYGARAANGIILITTKKPAFKERIRVGVNSFFTFSSRPNVYYIPTVQPKDYVSQEEELYNSGFYRPLERRNVAVTPVIETLIDHRNGNITTKEKEAILNEYSRHDIRSDIRSYYYRPAITSFNGVNFSGSSDSLAIYCSLSHGRSVYNESGIEHNRNTMLMKGLYHRKKISVTTGLFYSDNRILNNFVSPPSGPAYLQLAGAGGEALAVPYLYRTRYIDSIGRYPLLDWKMRPLQELQNANNSKNHNYLTVNSKMDFQLLPSLQIQGFYQYGLLNLDQRIVYNPETFYARDLINTFTQITPTGIYRPVPAGAVADEHITTARINNLRGQLNYHFKEKDFELTVLSGSESRSTVSTISRIRRYGYSPAYSNENINYTSSFPQYLNPGLSFQIPAFNSSIDSVDFYFSHFGNAFLTLKKKITISLSARRDQSNRFGMNVNRQFIPLWAAGALVHLHKFNFFPATFPYISLRATIGQTGNDVFQTSWSNTISQVSDDQINGFPVAYINNRATSNLQFEEMHTINVGLDIKTRDRRIQLSLDAYGKRGNKLLGYSPADPTTGFGLVKSNTGALSGFGIDANINTLNIKRNFTWETNGWVSYTANKVRSREILLDAAWKYVDPSTYIPRRGYPVDAIFALPMARLDATGDPVGYLDGKESKNYRGILNSAGQTYMGSATPIFFSSIINTLQFKNWIFTIQITGKFNYYFRRTSLSANDLLLGANMHSDFYKRWQKPGDEIHTTVPALDFSDEARDLFYQYSDALIERGDHIRLQCLQLMYDLKNILPFNKNYSRLQIGFTCNNLCIIWRANRKQLDPDVVSGMLPVPLSMAMSIKAQL